MADHAGDAGPLAEAARLVAAAPDVLADPDQVGEAGVWTLSSDVLPGTVVRPGQELVAAWGPLTWRGLPHWDPWRRDLLWLTPVSGPVADVRLATVYSAETLASAILRQLADSLGPREPMTGAGGSGDPAAVVETALAPVFSDIEMALGHLTAALAEHRAIARAVLSALTAYRLPRRFYRSPAGIGLLRAARRARPPHPGESTTDG